jgi:RNA polymerase sigma-70 factor (ECF subfamily)
MLKVPTGSDLNAAAPQANGTSDRDLLERLVATHDEVAFAELVARHGPMVWAVCCRVVRQAEDAEDAFQATFLVLVRRARSIGQPELLGNWLYGVAYRTAQKARAAAARRRSLERQAASMPADRSSPEIARQELRTVLDEALHGLPQKYRAPLVLCYLEGKTNAEAARLLGWPTGSMSARLSRARELLREQLSSRGQFLPAGLFGVMLAEQAGPVMLPLGLAEATVRAARGFLAGQLATVVAPATRALAEDVVAGLHRTRLSAGAVLLVLLVATGLAGGLAASGLVGSDLQDFLLGTSRSAAGQGWGTGHHTTPGN